MDLTEINHSYEPYTEGSVVKRNFIFGIGQFVTGLGLLVSGLGLSLNAQAAAVNIDAINISSTPTPISPNTFSATIGYSTPTVGFALDASQDPVISYYPITNANTNTTIQIDLYFVSPGQATLGGAPTVNNIVNNELSIDLGVLAAGSYDITAYAYLSGCANINCASSYTNSMVIPAVPIPAAIWLFLSGLAPLVMIGRRKFRA